MKQVVVAGAGAIGLAAALALAKDGWAVTVRDPAPLGDNASGVAAGMLAPAFEAALDPMSAGRFALLKAARDLWPGMGVALDRSGAVYRGSDPEGVTARLRAIGASGADDWRLRPMEALQAMREAARRLGVRFEQAEAGEAEILIVATGAEGQGLAPELAVVRPVKGHILRVLGGPTEGPVIRGDGVYVCPDPEHAIVGATMEPGEAGRTVDPAKAGQLVQAAEALLPGLSKLGVRPYAGVRAETPDGLPLVGPSAWPGVFLGVGARRNGWLLAPLVGRMLAAYLRGDDPGPFAAQLDAQRFSRGDRP